MALKFGPGIRFRRNIQQPFYVNVKPKGKSFSLYYNDLVRWLFITLTFSGILSTGWFGIPLTARYLLHERIDLISGLSTLFSALSTIWGIMAYSEFTRSSILINEARELSRRLDPSIGDYEYLSYNPETKEYENGYIPLGPVDFWDRETQVPSWLDKGKYWRILLGFQSANKEIFLQVVRDCDLPFIYGKRNVAVTFKQQISGTSRKRYVYRIKIPQWIVMNTERSRLLGLQKEILDHEVDLSSIIADLNKKLVLAADEIIEHEKPRTRYPWSITTIGIYLNKSLPLRIIYRQTIRHFPGSKKRTIDDTNANLANVRDDELINVIMEVGVQKGISDNRLGNIYCLIRFLKNSYTKQGLGEGSSEYHNFHHTLEVTYMCIQILPKEFRGHSFGPRDYELILVSGLLHDYDPIQIMNPKYERNKQKGPKVSRTIDEIDRTRILDAYFTMNRVEFENYFRDYKSTLLPPIEFSTTHPEHVRLKEDHKLAETMIVEALIWHTDFPYERQEYAKEKFSQLLSLLKKEGYDAGKIKLLAEILWIADLVVTYMGSDPIRAWDRVTNLYDELDLPKVEAVSRTDAFFSDFADTELFRELISMRQFPDTFRQRWNMIYQFFHEGNPSTQINRIITKSKNLYLKINLEIAMHKVEMLQQIATNNWAEYFIGIGRDQNEVLRAKSKFADLDPQNASAFWGDIKKLLPNILDNSIDNFLMVLPQNLASFKATEEKLSLGSLLTIIPSKLTRGGTLQLLTDLAANSETFKDLLAIILDMGFQIERKKKKKIYFPKGWKDPYFIEGRIPQVMIFELKVNK